MDVSVIPATVTLQQGRFFTQDFSMVKSGAELQKAKENNASITEIKTRSSPATCRFEPLFDSESLKGLSVRLLKETTV